MNIKMTPTHWFRVAGAGGIMAALYVAWVAGDASDGHIGVSPQINAAAVVWPAAILATIVILAGVARMMTCRDRRLEARFDQVETLIEGVTGGQSLAAALKVPTGEFQRVNRADVLPSPGTVAAMRRLADKVTRVD